jgi:hypothetical protein
MKGACELVFAVVGIVGVQAASDDKPKETPMTKDSAWTSGYFFAENDSQIDGESPNSET